MFGILRIFVVPEGAPRLISNRVLKAVQIDCDFHLDTMFSKVLNMPLTTELIHTGHYLLRLHEFPKVVHWGEAMKPLVETPELFLYPSQEKAKTEQMSTDIHPALEDAVKKDDLEQKTEGTDDLETAAPETKQERRWNVDPNDAKLTEECPSSGPARRTVPGSGAGGGSWVLPRIGSPTRTGSCRSRSMRDLRCSPLAPGKRRRRNSRPCRRRCGRRTRARTRRPSGRSCSGGDEDDQFEDVKEFEEKDHDVKEFEEKDQDESRPPTPIEGSSDSDEMPPLAGDSSDGGKPQKKIPKDAMCQVCSSQEARKFCGKCDKTMLSKKCGCNACPPYSTTSEASSPREEPEAECCHTSGGTDYRVWTGYGPSHLCPDCSAAQNDQPRITSEADVATMTSRTFKKRRRKFAANHMLFLCLYLCLSSCSRSCPCP